MGCTSSAPNMANSSTAEKSIQFEDDKSEDNSNDVEEIIYRAAKETNVLPSCDTLSEPVDLVRNKSIPSLKNDKDHSEELQFSEHLKEVESSGSLYQEDKVTNLKEIVDKVVGIHMIEHNDDTQPVEKEVKEPTKTEINTEEETLKDKNAADENINDSADAQVPEKEDHSEEALSPSQSESSRATRWEALADIQAELPPSLTIDPVTGQIYALSK